MDRCLSVVIRRVSQRIMEDKVTTDSSMLQKQIGSWIKEENKIHESNHMYCLPKKEGTQK